VKITGEINPDTGFVMNLLTLGKIIKEEIEDRFDHKNLNLDCPEFKNTMVSTENFGWIIYGLLKSKLPIDCILKVVLYETDKNFVEIEE
jgi:6-pyruvoyltetrahydropterin/6-carboxytetrahydropterin synthase